MLGEIHLPVYQVAHQWEDKNVVVRIKEWSRKQTGGVADFQVGYSSLPGSLVASWKIAMGDNLEINKRVCLNLVGWLLREDYRLCSIPQRSGVDGTALAPAPGAGVNRRGGIEAHSVADSLPGRLQQPLVLGHFRGLTPCIDVQLGEDAAHVALDCVEADHQFIGDLPVRGAAGGQAQRF